MFKLLFLSELRKKANLCDKIGETLATIESQRARRHSFILMGMSGGDNCKGEWEATC